MQRILIITLILGVLAVSATAQVPAAKSNRMILSTGFEVRADETDRLDQSLTATIGFLRPLRSFLALSGSIAHTPRISSGGATLGNVQGFDLGFRLQDTRGPWAPFIGLFYDLRYYSWTGDYAPGSSLNGGIGLRTGLAYRFSRRLGFELYFHGVHNAVDAALTYSATGRPDTQQNQSGIVKSGSSYDRMYGRPVFNPTAVGLSLTIQL